MKESISFFNAELTALDVAVGLAHSDAVKEYRHALNKYLSSAKRDAESIKSAISIFIAPVLAAIKTLPIGEQEKAENATDRALKRALESADFPSLGFFTLRAKGTYLVCHIDDKKPAKAQAAAYAGALAKAKELHAKANAPKPVKTGKGAPARPDAILPETPVEYSSLQSAVGLVEKLLAETGKLTKADAKALAGLGLAITAKLAPKPKAETSEQASPAPVAVTA